MKRLSHVSSKGNVMMVDVGHKEDQARVAVAQGEIRMRRATVQALRKKALPKGDVLTTAQIAGIQAAKRTSELIPLCHTLALQQVSINFTVKMDRVLIEAMVKCIGKTGVEMEALTAVTVAALTLYDMCKAIDKTMRIGNIRLLSKTKNSITNQSVI